MERVHRLLMIGVDNEALAAVAGEGIEVTVVFGAYTRDIGVRPPDWTRVVFVDDTSSMDAVVSALDRAGLGVGSFDAVYAHSEQTMIVAALLAQLFGAEAVPVSVVTRFRDKYLQKQRLREVGLPVARSVVIEDIATIPPDFTLPFERTVIKPIAGSAAQLTFIATEQADLGRISQECRGSTMRTFVAEEFVTGDEWIADGIVSDGVIRFLSLGRYGQTCISAVDESAAVEVYTMDPIVDKVLYDLLEPVVSPAVAALGLTDGIFHMELFHDPATNRVVFSECAARRAGLAIPEQIRHKFGVDMAYYGLMTRLEKIDHIPTRVREGVVGSISIQLQPGTLVDHPSVADLLAIDDVVFARIFVPKGLRVLSAGHNTFLRMGEFSVHGPDYQHVSRRLGEVLTWFTQRLEVIPLDATMNELFQLPRNAGFVHADGTYATAE